MARACKSCEVGPLKVIYSSDGRHCDDCKRDLFTSALPFDSRAHSLARMVLEASENGESPILVSGAHLEAIVAKAREVLGEK